MKKVALYWNCQLIGWTLFGLVCVSFVLLNAPRGDRTFAIVMILKMIGWGLLISHMMRLTIKKTRIASKSLPLQIAFLIGSTIVFTTVYIFLLNLIQHGWKVFVGHNFLIVFSFQFIFISGGLLIWNLIYFVYHYIRKARTEEKQKISQEKELWELEAKALRARMNPHFIFNCLNSIKALIQNNDQQKAIDYLTIFSKLIRTLFYNSDKKRISLFDEITNCRLYTQLEAMRLDGKLSYTFLIDPNIDLKSVMVPALIVQPFLENAIWHGIVPKGGGSMVLTVKGTNEKVVCEIDDDGIGRDISKLNKPLISEIYQSKGTELSAQRLQIEKLLNETNAFIETTDKYNDDVACGTKVIISFNLC